MTFTCRDCRREATHSDSVPSGERDPAYKVAYFCERHATERLESATNRIRPLDDSPNGREA